MSRRDTNDSVLNPTVRILQLVATLDIGGLERLAVDLARQHLKAGYETSICCMRHRGPLASAAEDHGIRVEAFDKRRGFSPGFTLRLARRLRARRIDVLHTHNALVHHYGALAARLAGVPVVVNTRHGFGGREWAGRREKLFRASLRWTDAVICVSEDLRRELVGRGGVPAAKARVIRNGVDLARFAALPAAPGSRRPAFRFGTVGRLVPEKDHDTLIRAFARARRQVPAAELHIMGEGPCAQDISALIGNLGLRNCVSLHGFSDAVPQFLSGLDVFVLSSASEGLPLAVLEAMAAGLPVVSTRLEGIEAVAPESLVALYAPPGNAAELASAMIAASRDSNLTLMSQAARETAAELGIGRTWREYETLFRELLGTAETAAA